MSFKEYLPYIVAFIIAAPFLIYMRQFVFAYIRYKEKEMKLAGVRVGGDSRLQAYERMMLFLERLKPANLVKEFADELRMDEYIYLLEQRINQEFDYNASLQMYISKALWQDISASKNDIIHLAWKTRELMNKDVRLDEYKTVFLLNYVNGEDFISLVQERLKKEALTIGN